MPLKRWLKKRMKISELIDALNEAKYRFGDKHVEICRYTAEDKKYYWVSCAFIKEDRLIIGYNIDSENKSLRTRGDHAV